MGKSSEIIVVEWIDIAARIGDQGPELAVAEDHGQAASSTSLVKRWLSRAVAAGQRHAVEVETEAAARHVGIGNEGEIQLRQDIGNVRCDVGGAQALEIIAAHGKAANGPVSFSTNRSLISRSR